MPVFTEEERQALAEAKKKPSGVVMLVADMASDFAHVYLASMYKPHAVKKYQKAMAKAIASAVLKSADVSRVIGEVEDDEDPERNPY